VPFIGNQWGISLGRTRGVWTGAFQREPDLQHLNNVPQINKTNNRNVFGVKRLSFLFIDIITEIALLLLWRMKINNNTITRIVFKVAEHSFQEPIPNSPLLLSSLSFGARFLQESRLTTEEFNFPFWLRCELLPWQRG